MFNPSTIYTTVEPPVNRHQYPQDQKKCLLKRGVQYLWEVKNVVFVCTPVAGNMTKCPLMKGPPMGGVHLWRFDCN